MRSARDDEISSWRRIFHRKPTPAQPEYLLFLKFWFLLKNRLKIGFQIQFSRIKIALKFRISDFKFWIRKTPIWKSNRDRKFSVSRIGFHSKASSKSVVDNQAIRVVDNRWNGFGERLKLRFSKRQICQSDRRLDGVDSDQERCRTWTDLERPRTRHRADLAAKQGIWDLFPTSDNASYVVLEVVKTPCLSGFR